MLEEELLKIVNSLPKFKNLYDIIRVVDSVRKVSLATLHNENFDLKEEMCYVFCKQPKPCTRCIAIKAYTQNDSLFEIVNWKGKLYLVIASPFKEVNSDTIIVEIIKDITQKGYILNEGSNTSPTIKAYLDEISTQVIVDELTGLYNRRYIAKMLFSDITRSIMFGYPICIIMTDIDGFKEINNTYGHLIGDKVLKDFASILKGSVRKGSDWVARYSEDESLIVANNTNEEGGYKLAEKLDN
ncbi:GGDEF domain-containing protein [Caldicellulosiruptor naganoensis]|uniref:GGDEF domain-containing protein n=1 Tax=Caldicellulosiruptor naganoensis TaxID=29324 RepID=A0ABY7BM34_9FIRM|nr:GGDEF domain-containing protein [Caldicellulosiruptor naganoensis]WAM32454.1 GGDEF domain-containing protein [Caldicellulosiruptor naganoensis]